VNSFPRLESLGFFVEEEHIPDPLPPPAKGVVLIDRKRRQNNWRLFGQNAKSSDFGFFSVTNLPEVISLYEQRKIHEAFLACCESELVRKDEVLYLSEIFVLLSKPIRLLRLIYLYIKAKRG